MCAACTGHHEKDGNSANLCGKQATQKTEEPTLNEQSFMLRQSETIERVFN